MSDDKGGIDFALLDTFEKLGQIVLDRRLGHAEGEPAVDGRSHRNLVEQSAVNADDRDGSEVTAAVDRLPENMRRFCAGAAGAEGAGEEVGFRSL